MLIDVDVDASLQILLMDNKVRASGRISGVGWTPEDKLQPVGFMCYFRQIHDFDIHQRLA